MLNLYKCWRCRREFLVEQFVKCSNSHTPGECCHEGESELIREEYEFAGSWVNVS